MWNLAILMLIIINILLIIMGPGMEFRGTPNKNVGFGSCEFLVAVGPDAGPQLSDESSEGSQEVQRGPSFF